MAKYNHQKIEKKWQKYWMAKKIYQAKDKIKGKKNKMLLVEFPYPSGNLHIGHWFAFAVPDIAARYFRMNGQNIMYPIGFDAFGLPAENAAIQRKINPRDWTEKNIKYMTRQLESMGAAFDWSRKVSTIDPEYYKWTQWLFLKMYEKKLAYRKQTMVNWCPSCKTVLANEQVIDGKCDRCGSQVVQKELEQWMFKITDYADRLIDDIEGLDWPDTTKLAQKNWIGRSEGALIKFKVKSLKLKVEDKNLKFDEKLVSLVLSGEKYITYRWNDKGFKVGDVCEFLNSQTGEKFALAKIIKVEKKKMKDISETQEGHERYKDRKEFYKTYEGYYKTQVDDDTDVWIYRFETVPEHIEIFTTRPDTVFGATYVVLAPEHQVIQNLESRIQNLEEVEKYIEQSSRKTDLDRQENKEKTGVELKGIKAINPANGKEVPVWISDYVLASYGTGAVMAVPAHDRRDFDFAKKFDLPIVQSVAPLILPKNNEDFPKNDKHTVERKTVISIVKHWSKDEFYCLNWEKFGWTSFVIGGIEDGESAEQSATRELREETGYQNFHLVRKIDGKIFSKFFAAHKNENRFGEINCFYFELENDDFIKPKEEHIKNHKGVWVKKEDINLFINLSSHLYYWEIFEKGEKAFVDDGYLVNSEQFTGMESENARREIVDWLGKQGKAERKKNYRLRDWVLSRQRYWGAPIPMINCEKCGYVSVPEKDLPVKLPPLKDFLPTDDGRSPLAKARKWASVKCPKCKGKAERETDTMDTFVDSSWYFIRYADPKNKKKFADVSKMKNWLPVPMYIGGAEHNTMHLLYSRFFTKVLYDLKLVNFKEPFVGRRNHGIILGPDGQKMSKSKGNVVDPDEEVKKYGADCVRMYLAFMGPYEQGGPWNPTGILGIKRFLDRVFALAQKFEAKSEDKNLEKLLHKTIKKVSEDVENFRFNTAVSSLMILVNEMEKHEQLSAISYQLLAKLLAPFAPHLTEEIWQTVLGNKKSIHLEKWPKYNPKLIKEDSYKLVVQINGKMRDVVEMAIGSSEEEIKKIILPMDGVRKWIDGKEIKKIIFVKDRLINFIVV